MSISQVARSIVNTHLLLPCDEPEEVEAELDGVTFYARELITLSLVWHYFHDASKEADGDRILLSWKIMLPIFKATTLKLRKGSCITSNTVTEAF